MPDANGMPLDSDECPTCGVLVLDHTLREFKDHHPTRSLNLPYEQTETVWTEPGSHGPIAGAVVCKSAYIDTGGAAGLPRRVPAIGFTFFGPDGLTEVAKALLALDVERMRQVGRLLSQAVNGAIRAATDDPNRKPRF